MSRSKQKQNHEKHKDIAQPRKKIQGLYKRTHGILCSLPFTCNPGTDMFYMLYLIKSLSPQKKSLIEQKFKHSFFCKQTPNYAIRLVRPPVASTRSPPTAQLRVFFSPAPANIFRKPAYIKVEEFGGSEMSLILRF